MTSTNMSFPMAAANAILEPSDSGEMPAVQTNSTKAKTVEPNDDLRWSAVLARDANHDGKFVFAVSSTGVYCRPSCPSRRPRRDNVTFFRTPEEAEKNGYRACLRCRPRAVGANHQIEMVKAVCRYIEQHL